MKGKTVNLFGLKINFFGRKSTKKPNIFFNAFRIDDTDEGKMIKVVPVGSFPNHHDGAHVIEPQQIREMAENIKNGGTDILFDFGHDSIWNSSARAAAWSPKEKAEAREDGLYIQYPTFTKSGMEAIENGEFRYFSPAYLMSAKDKQGRIIGAYLHSVGLTNKPYMDVEIDHVANSQIAEETDMKISPEALAKLGLDENATEAQINAAILAYLNLDALDVGMQRAKRQRKIFYLSRPVILRLYLMLGSCPTMAVWSGAMVGTQTWYLGPAGYLVAAAHLYVVWSYTRLQRSVAVMLKDYPELAGQLYNPEKTH